VLQRQGASRYEPQARTTVPLESPCCSLLRWPQLGPSPRRSQPPVPPSVSSSPQASSVRLRMQSR